MTLTRKSRTTLYLILSLLGLLGAIAKASADDYKIYYDKNSKDLKTVAFGVSDLTAALDGQNHTVSATIDISKTSDVPASETNCFIFALDKNAGDEDYKLSIDKSKKRYTCTGGRVGLMYGAFDFREAVRIDGLNNLKVGNHTPYLEKRGLKLNIPLDARTPSYADFGTAAQENIEQMWSMGFWTQQLDQMARNRYNCYTLWNLHPFPSLVKLKNFPDVALDDVMVANIDLKDKNDGYNTKGIDMIDDDLRNPENLVAVKKMTIDQKIKFWQDVMDYGHDRGIEFHFYTWNVFVWGAEGKNGIVTNDELLDARDNWTRFRGRDDYDRLVKYFREGTEALFETYPRLAGIGVTAGEGFGDASDREEEEFLADTYGQGVLDAAANEPDRKITFVHRAHQASDNDIENNFGNLMDHPNILFEYSTKYVNARLYSYAGDNQGKKDVSMDSTPPRGGGKWWLNLRNDSIFNFRWGDYDFAKLFLTSINLEDDEPLASIRGFHMGPDGYVFGREFADKNPEPVRQLEHNKHWLKFMLWGRLGYDPNTPEELFAQEATARLGVANPDQLMSTWKTASKIIPAINRYYYKKLDYNYHPEYNARRKPRRGFIKVDDFGKDDDWKEVANELDGYASSVLSKLDDLRKNIPTTEYRKTVDDLECFAHLAAFYADFIRAAAGSSKSSNSKKAAIHWRDYAMKASSLYIDQVLGRVVSMNWEDFYHDFLSDSNIDENELPAISINSPIEDPNLKSSWTLPLNVTFPLNATVQVSDADGSVEKVQMLLNGESFYMIETNQSTINVTVPKPASGLNILEARATDNDGHVSTTYMFIEEGDGSGDPDDPSDPGDPGSGDPSSLPWIEKFDLANLTELDEGSTAWSTDWMANTDSAQFSVQDGEFKIAGKRVDGILTTETINLGGATVSVSVDVKGIGDLEVDQDYVELWAIVDNGPAQLLGSVTGLQETWTTISKKLSGQTVKLQVKAYCSWSNETYFLDNLKVVTEAESLPWVEDFNLADGTTKDESPANTPTATSWTSTRDGTFEVQDQRMIINGDGSIAKLTSAPINIAGDAVEISLDFESDGGVDEGEDYAKLYATIDGTRQLLYTNWKTDGAETFKVGGITGNTLILEIETFVSSSRESYFFDNLSVKRSSNSTPQAPLPWIENFEDGLNDGDKEDTGPTSWTASHPAGFFAVKDKQLYFDDKGTGILLSGPIDISGQTVRASLDVRGEGDLESNDYVKFSIVYSDGTKQFIGEVSGRNTRTITSPPITGSNIRLEIEAKVSWGGEAFWMDNLKVEAE